MGTNKLTRKEYDEQMEAGLTEGHNPYDSFDYLDPAPVDYDTYIEQIVDGTFVMVTKYLNKYSEEVRNEVLAGAETDVRKFVYSVERCSHAELVPLLDSFLKEMFRRAEVLFKEKIIADIDQLKELVYTAPSKEIRDLIRDFSIRINERIDKNIFLSGKASDYDIYLVKNIERMNEYLKDSRRQILPKNAPKREIAPIFDSFESIAVNSDALVQIYKILISRSIIDEHHVLKSTSTKLYSFIRKMKKLGYFKPTPALTGEIIHSLTNQEFKCQATYNLYKNVSLAKDIPYFRI